MTAKIYTGRRKHVAGSEVSGELVTINGANYIRQKDVWLGEMLFAVDEDTIEAKKEDKMDKT